MEASQKLHSALGSRQFLAGPDRELIKQSVLRELLESDKLYSGRSGGAADQAVAENIKNELLAELGTSQSRRLSGRDSWQSILSDRNIDRRIDQQYSSLRNLRSEIRRGLEAARDSERHLANISDPRIREAINTIIEEARQEAVPLDQIISRLNANERFRTGMSQRLSSWLGSGAGRGFISGVGVSLAAILLFPAARSGIRSAGIKMMQGTMDLAGQTRSAFGRAKEGFEDMIAEANFNNLRESEEFPPEVVDPAAPQEPLDDNPLH